MGVLDVAFVEVELVVVVEVVLDMVDEAVNWVEDEVVDAVWAKTNVAPEIMSEEAAATSANL